LAEISSRGFASTAILLDLIADLLAIGEGRETRAFDSRNVNENVLTAVIGLNETKTLSAIEPLYRSSRHPRIPSCNATRQPSGRSASYRDLEINAAKARNRKNRIERPKYQLPPYGHAGPLPQACHLPEINRLTSARS